MKNTYYNEKYIMYHINFKILKLKINYHINQIQKSIKY